MLEGTHRRHQNFNWVSSLADIATTATIAAMAALHDATGLIERLTSKLAELDSKVAAYRLDMAAEFTRYSEELLRSVPEDVAYRVSRAIADQIANYPSLYPPGSLSSSRSVTPTNLDDISWRGKGSPPPTIIPQVPASPNASGSETPRQRDPHEREQEFQGLFTPTYLPLLESVDRPLHSPTSSSTAEPATIDRRLSTGDAQDSNGSRRRGRPSPLRRATDTSVDSVVSDSSSAKTRKSALRRSSGSSKADSPRDPRRVRFDFQGQEVLPSSSPQTSSSSLNKTDGTREKSALTDESYSSSIGDIEGEEDLRDERPKKVSSTQALRALSKAPLDQETVWTVVNPGTEAGDSSDADKNRKPATAIPTLQSSLADDEMTIKRSISQLKDGSGGQAQAQAEVKDDACDDQSKLDDGRIEAEEEDSEEGDSEEEMMFMSSKRGIVKSKAAATQDKKPHVPVSVNASTRVATERQPSYLNNQHVVSPTPAKPQNAGTNDFKATTEVVPKVHGVGRNVEEVTEEEVYKSNRVDDDEDFFDFDDDDNEKPGLVKNAAISPPKKYLPESLDEENEEGKTDHDPDATKVHSDIASLPPVNDLDSAEKTVPAKVPTKPEGTRVPSTSIGSFVDRDGRKRFLTPGPLKDPELLKKLENLDIERPFFVGSVNGNSGVDASNVKSYQASLMSPTQTSGSFAERLMWEKSQGMLYDSDNEDGKADKNGRR